MCPSTAIQMLAGLVLMRFGVLTRKTCGSLLAALDVHPRVAMQILRHSRVSMEIYTEVPSASTREALRKLGRWLEDTQT
jgi:hypothetical protein